LTSPQQMFNPVNPQHYARLKIEPWDYVAANNMGYFEGSVIKYVSRWREKNGIEDLKKARAFLDKLIEVELAAMKKDQG
jgi:hypothetical protein